MKTFSLSPHSCRLCERIEIDGTGPKFEQRFEFFFREVEIFAQDCAFFNRTLKLLDTPPLLTDKLILSISEDSEDLAYLDINWQNVNGRSVSEDNTKQLGLYIFSEKGKLSKTTCYAPG
jgi:hypothetical protein